MRSAEANNPLELTKALIQTQTQTTWVDRKVLVQLIGIEAAERVLPELPEKIAINVEQVLSYVPDTIYKQAEDSLKEPPAEQPSAESQS